MRPCLYGQIESDERPEERSLSLGHFSDLDGEHENRNSTVT
jgi:hypothetical protein